MHDQVSYDGKLRMTTIRPQSYDQSVHQRFGAGGRQREGAGAASQGFAAATAIKVSDVRAIDLSGIKSTRVAELPSDQYERFVEDQRRSLEAQYTIAPDRIETAGHAAFDLYASVGSVEINNAGHVTIYDDDLAKRVNREIYEAGKIPVGLEGPQLAAEIARQIARLTGNTISKARTALTQADYAALPVLKQPGSKIDEEAMRADPFFTMLERVIAERKEYVSTVTNSS